MLIIKFFLSWKVLPEGCFLPIKELLIISFFLFGSLNVDFHFVFVFADVPIVIFEIEVDLAFKSLLEIFKGILQRVIINSRMGVSLLSYSVFDLFLIMS